MNSLYKKIYEAINTGIQKALVLPDEMDLDVSVKFRHKKISNNVDIMGDYVRNLLSDDDSEYYYGQILEYHKETHKKYKVNNFNELTGIFDKIKDIEHLNMQWINLSDVVTIIQGNGQEIPFDWFDLNIHTIKFIKFKNNITGHDIILHKDLLLKEKCKWIINDVKKSDFNDIDCINDYKYGSLDKAVQIAEQDYDGYKHTYHNVNIKSNKRDISNYPAFKYCIKDLKNTDQKYEAYLPSMGELRFLYDNQYLINYVLEKVKGKEIIFNNNCIWSSSESSNYNAWNLTNGTTRDFKTYNLTILPIFALKTKI